MLIFAEIGRIAERLAKGDSLTFSFFLPDGTRISAQGTIERIIPQTAATNACLYGIRFTELAPDVQSAIEGFIRKEQHYKR